MRIIIAGGGEVGSLIARRLVREGNEIVIIEEDTERCSALEEMFDVRVVCGSAASVRVLREAGLANADMLIAITSMDAINIMACMAAQAESAVKVKVARLRTPEIEDWKAIYSKMGLHLDLIIQPELEATARILRVLRVPGVSDIIDFADGRVRLFGMNIEADSPFAGVALEDLDRAGPPKNSLIALIFRGSQVIIPHGGARLEAGDHAYIVTTAQETDATMRFMGVKAGKLQRVLVLGGKQAGIWMAQHLEAQGVNVTMFEKDARRCEKIAGILRKTIIINADGMDESTLTEHSIENSDAYLALTGDDEDNIIACLLARRLGARKVVALTDRLNYFTLAQRLGINALVSPRLAAVDRILQFVRKGRVLSVTTFREEEAEAIELLADPHSRFVGKRLRDLRLPREAIVGAIARPDGQVIVPRGEATIQAGDRVIFFALSKVVQKLETAFLADARSALR
jgi:trk system potassium uptake protein TrkA